MTSIENEIINKVYNRIKGELIIIEIPGFEDITVPLIEIVKSLESKGLDKKTILRNLVEKPICVNNNCEYQISEKLMNYFVEFMNKYVNYDEIDIPEDNYDIVRDMLFRLYGEYNYDNVLLIYSTFYGFLIQHLDKFLNALRVWRIKTPITNVKYIISWFIRKKKCGCGKYHYYSFTILYNRNVLYQNMSPYELEKVWLS